MNTLAAAVAFFALGVTFMGTALLLLFNPRASSVRWFSVFQLSLMVWLAAQGWAYATDGWDRLGPIVSGAVHMAPGLFLAFSIRENHGSMRGAVAAILLALALLPLDLASVNARETELVLAAWDVLVGVLRTIAGTLTVESTQREGTVLSAVVPLETTP